MTPSQATDTPQPLAVDYSGRPLHVGDTVAYIGTDPVCLRQGHIRVIGPNDLCIESGAQLVVFTGTHAGWAETAARPLGGKADPNEDLAHVRAYPHVALQDSPDSRADLEEAEAVRKRVAKAQKEALTEALGMDRLRDWDDILNAATGLRKKLDAQSEELERPRSEGDVGVLQNRLRLAHQARRAKEHQLDDVRRALCDAGFMDDGDPYSHADLADVIRQAGQTDEDAAGEANEKAIDLARRAARLEDTLREILGLFHPVYSGFDAERPATWHADGPVAPHDFSRWESSLSKPLDPEDNA